MEIGKNKKNENSCASGTGSKRHRIEEIEIVAQQWHNVESIYPTKQYTAREQSRLLQPNQN